MGQYTSYWLYQKYETRGSQDPIPCYPNVYSVDGDGTMPLHIKNESDIMCGGSGGCDVRYDWVEIPISEEYICDDCDININTRWIDYEDAFTYFGDYKYGIQVLEIKVEDGEWTRTDNTKYTTNPIEKVERKIVADTIGGISYSMRCGTSDGEYYNYYSPIEKWYYHEKDDNSGLFDDYKLCRGLDLFTLSYDEGRGSLSSDYQLIPNEIGSAISSITFGDCITELGYQEYCTGYNQHSNPSAQVGLSIGPSLVSVTLPNTIEKIGAGVFNGNPNLTSITFPDSLKRLGSSEPAFHFCDGAGLAQPNSGAFRGCGLTDVYTNKIEQIGKYAFASNEWMLRVTIGSACTRLDECVFDKCSRLQQIVFEGSTVPICHRHGDTENPVSSNVTWMLTNEYDYYGHSPEYLAPWTKIYVPCDALDTFKNSSLTTYKDRMYGYGGDCGELPPVSHDYKFKNITISNSLKRDVIPDYYIVPGVINESVIQLISDTSDSLTINSFVLGDTIRSISGGAFRSGEGSSPIHRLASFTLNDGLISIGEGAFLNYQGHSVVIPDSVTSIGESAFRNDWAGNWHGNITNIEIGSGITAIPDRCFERSIGDMPVLTIQSHITSIGASAFTDCSATTVINIPDSVTTIGKHAFSGCSNIQEIHIGSGITNIGEGAFYKTRAGQHANITIESLTPPEIVFSSDNRDVWNNSTMYVHCSAFSDYWTAYKTNGSYTGILNTIESDCPGKNLTRWVESGTTCVGYDKYNQVAQEVSDDFGQTWSANGITSATTLIEPDSLDCGYVPSTFKAHLTYGGENYYVLCNDSTTLTSGETKNNGHSYTAMTEAVIGDCVETIGTGAFNGCSGLTSVTIGSGVTEIGTYGFRLCTSLSSITIPNSVTEIGYSAFTRCQNITNIEIPDSVTEIGRSAFDGCSSLTSVTCLATTPPTLRTNAFAGTNNCPIYVPASSVDAYKAATNWSTYASRIYPIP